MKNNKIKAIKTGEFYTHEDTKFDSSRIELFVKFKIGEDGDPATMRFNFRYEEEPTIKWWFDEDKIENSDFSMFAKYTKKVVDYEYLIEEAKAFLREKKEEAKKKLEQENRIKREKAYNDSFLINELKPALEALKYEVAAPNREDFINKKVFDLWLKVGNITIDYEWNGYLSVRNDKYGNERIEKKTKSAKLKKIVEVVEDVIATQKRHDASKKKQAQDNLSTEKTLEKILGTEILTTKEGHSNGLSGTRHRYWESTVFTRKKDCSEYSVRTKIEEIKSKDSTEYRISNLPKVSAEKLAKIFAILDE